MEKEIEAVQSGDVVVENIVQEKVIRKSLIPRILLAVLVAVLSFGVASKKASNPETYKKYIETLDKKQKNVLLLSASTAGVATLISVVGGDHGQAISNKMFDITGYFLLILCSIMLEKYLAGLLGLVAFKVIVPFACLLYIISALRMDKIIKQLSIKLCIFAISVVFVIPGSVEVSNFIESVYKIDMEQTINEASEIKNDIEKLQKENEESEKAQVQTQINEMNNMRNEEVNEIESDSLEEKKTGFGAFLDGAKNMVNKATNKITTGAKTAGEAIVSVGRNILGSITVILNKGADFFNKVVESVAIMIVTSCVIPIVVILIYLWLIKMLFGLDFKIIFDDIPKLSNVINKKKK